MKIKEKIIGSVESGSLCRSGGNLLFATGNDVIITGGENGEHIIFHSFNHKVTSMAAAINEQLVAVGTENGFAIFRVTKSQQSCLAISRYMSHIYMSHYMSHSR